MQRITIAILDISIDFLDMRIFTYEFVRFFFRRSARERPTTLDETSWSSTDVFVAKLHGSRAAAGLSNELSASIGQSVRRRRGEHSAHEALRISDRIQRRLRIREAYDTRGPFRSQQC